MDEPVTPTPPASTIAERKADLRQRLQQAQQQLAQNHQAVAQVQRVVNQLEGALWALLELEPESGPGGPTT